MPKAASSLSPTGRTPVVLVIRDGWGHNPNPEHDAFNAVKLARTPVADRLMRAWPNTLVVTCGEDVGLPAGTMGNSEVGHQNIGAGRIVDQELMRITRAVRDGSFFRNKACLGAFEHARQTGGKVHLLGLVSDGKVHSDLEHLLALINLARQQNFPADRLLIHAITDGRDVGPTTGLGFITLLEDKLARTGIGRIATLCGRYYAMDRDHRWDRVKRAYTLLTDPQADDETPNFESAESAVREYYAHPSSPSQHGDEFITPRTIAPDGRSEHHRVRTGDAVIFFNFRGDRPRELTKAFMLDDQAWANVQGGGFARGERISNLYFCTMTGYEAGLPVSATAFDKPPSLPNILGQVVSDAGLTQFRCAETEKFPHVTFFFNDYREGPFPDEHRELIQSPKDVTTYDQKPQMSAAGVCDAVLRRLGSADCEALIIVNFANPDMVGHTGKLDAAIQAVEVVDECVGRIVEATLTRGGRLIVTADHGNAEQMWDPINNCPHTAHTTYDVPLIVIGKGYEKAKLRTGGRLADIAATVLAMMGLEQSLEMTGMTLVRVQLSKAVAPTPEGGR